MDKALLDSLQNKARSSVTSAPTSSQSALGSGADFSVIDFLGATGKSVFENTANFLTGTPVSADTAAFDAKHDTLGLAIDIGSTVAPYMAGAKVLKVARNLGRAEDLAEDIPTNAVDAFLRKADKLAEDRPFLGGALREAAYMAPTELARQAAHAATGNYDEGTAAEGVVNEITGGLLGGTFNKIISTGKAVPKLADLVPEAVDTASLQEKRRLVKNAITEGRFSKDAERASLADNAIYNLNLAIRDESPFGGNFATGTQDDKTLNRLWKWGSGQSEAAKSITLGNLQDDTLAKIGLQGDWENHTQFPRVKEFTKPRAAQTFEYVLRTKLKPVSANTFVDKETDGLWVVAKKYQGQVGKTDSSDKWFIGKMDDAGMQQMFPQETNWKKNILSETNKDVDFGYTKPTNPMAFGQAPKLAKIGVEGFDNAVDFIDTFPLRNVTAAVRDAKSLSEAHGKVEDALGLSKLENTAGVSQVKDFLRAHITPAMYQFKTRPMAGWVRQVAKSVFDDYHARANAWLYGENQLAKDRSTFSNIFKKSETNASWKGTPAIKPLLDKLTDADRLGLWNVASKGMGLPEAVAELAAGRISAPTYEVLKTLDKYDTIGIAEMLNLGKALGTSTFVPRQGHYLISHTWMGDFQVPVYNANRDLVYIASHTRPDKAEAIAKDIVEKGKAEGRNLSIGKLQTTPRSDLATWNGNGLINKLKVGSPDFEFANAAFVKAFNKVQKPGFFNERKGIGGYSGDSAPWTKEDLEGIISRHIQNQHRFMAEAVAKHVTQNELSKMRADDPGTWSEVSQRINDMAGRPGPLSAAQNAVVDKALSRFLGKDSATKIVGATNNLVYQLQLGMGNVMFPIMNGLTFMQTVLPEAAFVLSARPGTLANRYHSLLGDKYHDMWVVNNPRGGGTLGSLSAPKMLVESFRRMGKPSEGLQEMLQRAAREGVTDPRLVEDYVGQNSNAVTNFREALSGTDGFTKWLGKVSNFMPAVSEKFARAQAFTTGHLMGEDVLKLEGEPLYRFAKEFTERTMFMYSPADRARVITGPIGSLFGLFKNWQMHYIGAMLEYTGEAYYRNNFAPLLWQLGGTSLVGGLAATPIGLAANGMSQVFTDKSLMQNIYDNFSHPVADGMYLGMPSMLGVSLSGQSETPGADPARDAAMMFSFVHADRAKALGVALGNAWDNYQATGEHPAKDPMVRDNLVRALAPKTLYRLMSTTEAQGIRSMTTGNKQFENVPLAYRMMYAAGMNPTEIELGYKVNAELRAKQDDMKAAVQRYGHAWMEAQSSNNGQEMLNLQRRIMAEGIDMSSVLRSANARLSKAGASMLDRSYKPEDISAYRNVLGND